MHSVVVTVAACSPLARRAGFRSYTTIQATPRPKLSVAPHGEDPRVLYTHTHAHEPHSHYTSPIISDIREDGGLFPLSSDNTDMRARTTVMVLCCGSATTRTSRDQRVRHGGGEACPSPAAYTIPVAIGRAKLSAETSRNASAATTAPAVGPAT